MPRPQNPPGDAAPSQTSSKFRVLSPELAKSRSSNPSRSSTPTSASTPSQNPQQQPHTHTSSRSRPSFFSRLRNTYSSLPYPVRGTFRVLRYLAPAIPIGIFFSEHVFQVMWVRGPSMTPYLNEDYEEMHTKSDMVLVNMWPWGGAGWPFGGKRRLERGMVVTFRFVINTTHKQTVCKRVRVSGTN